MKKLVSIILSFLFIYSMAYMALPHSIAALWSNRLWTNALWTNGMWTNGMWVNGFVSNGMENYCIVAVNDTGLYYFTWWNPIPLWWYETSVDEPFKSVAVSANCKYVVVGDNSGDNTDSGYVYYFADADEKNGLVTEFTWMSVDLGGPIEPGMLDVSDDGDYVVAGVPTTTIDFFGDCITRSGLRQSPTWFEEPLDGTVEILTVDMSSNGKYVAAGGADSDSGFVVFYKDAWSGPDSKWIAPGWPTVTDISMAVSDIAVSDDGYAVAAVEEDGLYYWADATSPIGESYYSWMNEGPYSSVDMSSDGDEVVAGKMMTGTIFWRDARDLPGPVEEAAWNKLVGEEVLNVAISDDGNIMVASTNLGTASENKAHFFASDGSLIGEFDLEQRSPLVSMSGDGSIVAVGGPGGLYVFRITKAPPVGGEILPIDIGAVLVTNLYHFIVALLVVAALIVILVKMRKR